MVMMEPPPPSSRSRTGMRLVVTGLILQAGVFVGLIGTVWGMNRAFEALGTSGVGDPGKVSAAIGEVLTATFVGLIVNNIGVGLFLTALWHHHLRERWMFWTAVVLGVLVVPTGLALLVFSLGKRHEFFSLNDRPRPLPAG